MKGSQGCDVIPTVTVAGMYPISSVMATKAAHSCVGICHHLNSNTIASFIESTESVILSIIEIRTGAKSHEAERQHE